MSQRDGFITDVEGIKVGHYRDKRRPTGCTVILCEEGAVASVDVRGSAPGTRETDLLDPLNHVEKAHAILLAGGSAFGLDAATGVMRYLEERGIGYVTPFAKVPIVPAAILYDLRFGDPRIRPDAEAGYQACLSARTGPVEEGSVGAGSGATVGKMQPGLPMKGGLGTASIQLPGGAVVASLVAVNCVGNVIDPASGQIVAGARLPDRSGFLDAKEWARSSVVVESTNTTIGVVATNIPLSKTQLKKVAQMGHDGMARVINPVHTPWDGDTLFAISTGTRKVTTDVGRIGTLAAEVVSKAILRAIEAATSFAEFPEYPAWRDQRASFTPPG
jgi:L-aminopeptidase/D-esterase-like protein